MSGFPIRPCLIILNGEIRDQKAVLDAARLCCSGKTPGAVLCSDGGLRHAASLKIVPDFVIGDMDSLPKPIPRFKKKRPLLRKVCLFGPTDRTTSVIITDIF